ncbi:MULTISPECIES: hypothetical protein [unclassified Microbacterium]|uniref:hypothetical protein n=1 Tax=unclassified Microbacterium TaxID=2609290 RepID=UPI00365B60C1
MTTTDFTPERAETIVAGALSSDPAAFADAVALSPGIALAADATVPYPRTLRLDAATFRTVTDAGTTATVRATADGESAELALLLHQGVWKIDSTGSDGTLRHARTS